MKIFSKEQIYEGDKLTTERQNISQLDLMERAGTQIFNWMHMRMQGCNLAQTYRGPTPEIFHKIQFRLAKV